uniref:Peroxisomal acyl-coenzyme A oxidase 1 n=1 Tax=Magallana gigas TaxID=29159 RepID=K1RMI6_MAGGI
MATTTGVNSDLAKERNKSTFDVEELSNFIYRGPEKIAHQVSGRCALFSAGECVLHNLATKDPFFRKFKPWAFQTREEQYEICLQKHLYINKKCKELNLTEPVDKFFYTEAAAPHENSPIGLHTVMFIPTIEKQGTEEQKKRWLPLAESLKMIGTYAQTEMGHGTFIRGLETTATYDPRTREFILNSPTITSMKYWPGNLGKTTNHCLVMAQLYTQGKNCGIHMFMVQIRDLETHMPLAGVETCRLCCGGHGYSHASGLPKIYIDVVPGCTYEGENNVMMLQVARFLMKMYGKLQNGEALPTFMQYMSTDLNKKSCMTEEVALNCLVMAYEHRAARMIRDAAASMEKLVQSGKSPVEAWNGSTVMLTWAAIAHCHAFVTKLFVETVVKSRMDSKVQSALTSLCKLYAVHGIVENLGGFIQDQFFDSKQVKILQKKLMQLLAEIRPNAVAFVDAFDYPDEVLQSCLGRYDGQVYQALYDYAKSSPMNEKEVLDSYYKYIKPAQNGKYQQYSKL